MAFNKDKFINSKYSHREEELKIPALKEFFDKDEEPIFRVRGITGIELGQVHEAVRKYTNIDTLMEKLLSTNSAEKIEAIRKALGITSDVPSEIVRRIEMLVIASVQPRITPELANIFCERFPIEFYQLTDTILKLTGMGMDLGKSKPSGVTSQ